MKFFKSQFMLGVMLTALVAPFSANAQDRSTAYPNKAVRIVIPFPAGQATDIIGRLLAERLAQRWGQPVFVENRGGGNAIPGMLAGKDAAPDGYTLTFGATSSTVINTPMSGARPVSFLNTAYPKTSCIEPSRS